MKPFITRVVVIVTATGVGLGGAVREASDAAFITLMVRIRSDG